MSNLLRYLNRSEGLSLVIGAVAVSIPLMKDFGVAGVAIVILSFLLHELGHRQAARRNGCHSRFLLDPMGLALTLISTFLPFMFLAPGYVGVFCLYPQSLSYRGQLEINAAGIAINLILASVSLFLSVILGLTGSVNELVVTGLQMVALINSWLAFFNLLPLGPLDGAKIFQLNRRIWLAGLLASLIILITVIY